MSNYSGDVYYEITKLWKYGHNPDMLDGDRARDMEIDGHEVEEAARSEIQRMSNHTDTNYYG